MSTILAVDSGGPMFSAALWSNDEVIQQKVVDKTPHSEHALPLVRQLLATVEMTLAQCDAFAFGAGPGRFSGLRLACGLAQTFAYASQRPLVATPSLAALAQANYGETETAAYAALPAHRGHLYLALCQQYDGRWHNSRPQLLEVGAVKINRRRQHCCGEGFMRYLSAAGTLNTTAPYPTAAAVATIAANMLMHEETTDVLAATPLYVRTQVAQTIAERQKSRKSKHQ
ncbi:tRNA (adenosine(37)-N6)-threonylcarbamoyltransferase complex dimerization subunit type 1 TsaB [Candidatus Persebacteraceae bacterium Df01]|uniref:tRNA threonylcarbamoyladenosine biosynthesis protein TsaB n=1 Tax=Candidatus Doriopsillibacter californiensis TaxID=2970740 RepID=A0ABT7QKM0_9GAMM|nr:tRNA (adenosine(37)-N6)-threonylcarbamoyltransferase complex dimerization subunit type 1 TsaB [Candidatus Persebacteraceae bacterium Df01]